MISFRLFMLWVFILIAGPVFSEAQAQKERNLLSSNYTQKEIATTLVPTKEWVPYPKYSDRQAWSSKIPEHLQEAYIEEGEKYLGYRWPNVTATDYLEFVRSGNRQIMQKPYNKKIKALEALVLAELMEGKGRFIDDIINGVWDFCEMTYWGLSAHLTLQEEGAGLPDINEPTIDLGAGMVAADLAWIYHFFKEEFDQINPLISERIELEIKRKILQPYYQRNDFWWMGFGRDFVNNWNPWVNYNVLNCILLLEKDEAKKKKYVYKVMRSVDQFINYYPQDGGSDEGPAYWNHAGGKLFDVLELLYNVTGGKVNVYDNEKIQNIGQYIYKAYINDRYFINFADAPNKITPRAGIIFRYGKRIDDSTMKGFGAFLAEKQGFGQFVIDGKIELALNNLFNLDEINSFPADEPLIKNFWLPQTQVAGVREKKGTNKGFYFAAIGSNNGTSHNHNDVGTFILYYNGKPAIVDAGVGTYTRKTFSSQRYEIWTMRSLYHNVPLINGTEQKAGTKYAARAVNFWDNGEIAKFVADISGAYPEAANVNSWKRTYKLNREKKRFIILDDFNLEKAEGKTSLNFLSSCKVQKIADNKAKIIGDDFRLVMEWDASKYDFKLEEINLEDPKLIKAWPNGLRRIMLYRTEHLLKDKSKVVFETYSE